MARSREYRQVGENVITVDELAVQMRAVACFVLFDRRAREFVF